MKMHDWVRAAVLCVAALSVAGLLLFRASPQDTQRRTELGRTELESAIRNKDDALRAKAFAAGYRTAQLRYYLQEFGRPIGSPLVDWEEEERQNAIANGFTQAAWASVLGNDRVDQTR
jgi:hypothetical protein